MSTSSTSPNPSSLLECGTSLSERAHYYDHNNHKHELKGDDSPEEKKESNNDSPTATILGKPSDTQGMMMTMVNNNDGENKKEITNINSIYDLRSMIACDVLNGSSTKDGSIGDNNNNNNNNKLLQFASPFENMYEKQRMKQINKHVTCNAPKYQLPLIYCDQTASNRPIQSIENYLQRVCLPFLGNTHTNTSITGSQTTAFCAESRQLIAEMTNAKITGKASTDIVLFAGNGATGAVELLIDCLGLKHHQNKAADSIDEDDSIDCPIIFVGPYEHHSNLLPWRESGCEIIMVPEKNDRSGTGGVDLVALENILKKYQHRKWKLGTFTAASNVTGIASDDNEICKLLHTYGALACFDYATAAPYTAINMNPTSNDPTISPALIAKDIIFFSPHKIIGSIGSPGVLIMKKHLINQINPPNRSGGGTVFYVTHNTHRFLSNRIERYEGGTPNIMGIMRLGLSCVYKRQIESQYKEKQQEVKQQQRGSDGKMMKNDDDHDSSSISLILFPPNDTLPKTLIEYEYQTHYRVSKMLQETIPNIVLLGVQQYDSNVDNAALQDKHQRHLPIFSFLIKCGRRFLHYNYVCAILNDIFGIQSRGGCQCAGPYSQKLLGLTKHVVKKNDKGELVDEDAEEIPNDDNLRIEHALIHSKERAELLRPGYTRLSLPFKGLHEEEIVYVIRAIQWTAKHAWKLLCHYRCSHRTGEWRHKSRQGAPLGRTERKWLSHYNILHNGDAAASSSTTNGAMEVGSGTGEGGFGASTTNQSRRNDLLERTLQHADRILDYVTSDQSSIVQTMKLNEGGDDDEQFEKLRWYVYPKDVAAHVATQGLDEVPGTNDRGNLLGPIRPFPWYSHDTVVVPTTVNGDKGISKNASVAPLASEIPPIKQDGTPTTMSDEKSSCETAASASFENLASRGCQPTMYSFREGEHVGQASLEELEGGYDDGELTDECQVYDSTSDDWVPVKAFLQSVEQDGPSKNDSPPLVETDMIDDEVGMDVVPSTMPDPPEIPASEKGITTVQLDEKNQKKKPSRDSSAWGQGTFSALSATASAAVTLASPPNQVGGAASAIDESMKDSSGQAQGNKRKKSRHTKPPPKLMRLVTQAMIQWDMIQDGDRLLLGLSGGKDSLSLLHVLLEFQKKSPIQFDIEVCTIDPMTPSFDPSPLIPYVESLGVKYHYIRDNIVDRATNAGKDGKMVTSLCAYCARMKRGNLYTCARNNNCNKLVLAQHLDDLAESFMMSVMHNGFLRTMKANYKINAGDLSVIRPLAYCRESLSTDFAKSANLPIVNENCPACFEEPKERARIKKLLTREETLYPNFYDNIRRSLLPLMHDDATAIMHCYTEEAVAKSRKENRVKKRPLWKTSPNGKKAKAESTGNSAQNGSTTPEANTTVEESIGSADETASTKTLSDASEDELVRELARRKAARFRLAGSMQRFDNSGDPTGQVCSLKGGDGCIPCRELME